MTIPLNINYNYVIVLDVMVLNDIIEQAAGRQSRGSEKAGMRL